MIRFALGRPALFALLAGLLVGACAGSTTETTQAEEMDMEEMMFSFGEPADAADADRVVEITANDDFSFDPDDITVSAGEVITFRVVNGGALIHDFTLGDEAIQQEHEAEMAEMAESGEMMMHDEPNTMSIDPGETNELTWHFTESGSVLIGCHEVGHYDSGMKGTITIES
jgi:uncharacterized cupredoxin-like copper-binding protein